ncbi:MAG: hypothetical protein HY403_03365 [Elusimicrobia bacterium]|nr:hypothetical protein [Elusimicrobiota bacterium]
MTTRLEEPAPPVSDSETRDPERGLIRRGRERRMTFDVPGYEEAVPLLREAIERCPTSAEAYAELSLTYSNWGLRREASCTGLRRELRVIEFQSLYDLAYDYAELALRLAPELAAARLAMAAALRRGARSDPERRAREALLAVELDGENLECLTERWRVQGYDPDDPAVRRAVQAKPPLLPAQLDLAASLAERGRYREALSELEGALRLHPSNAQVYYEVAMLLDRKGFRAKALELLGHARRLRPEDPLVRQGFALLGEAA